jgi:hypothetical protein
MIIIDLGRHSRGRIAISGTQDRQQRRPRGGYWRPRERRHTGRGVRGSSRPTSGPRSNLTANVDCNSSRAESARSNGAMVRSDEDHGDREPAEKSLERWRMKSSPRR